MSVPANLAERIDETRITYPETEHGVRIEGAPFICELDDPVDPEVICETICTPECPWKAFGVKREIGDGYWKVVGNLFHVTDGDVTDTSPFTVEVTDSWIRMYVKEKCCEERAADFVEALHEEFGITVVFGGEQTEDSTYE